MTNEQREAIDRLQELVNLRKRKNNIKHDTCICGTRDLDTVLALIKEQQDKIAKYEKIYKEYDCYRWVKELDKKDKQIDLMARAFKQDDVRTVEEIKQYFENKVDSSGQN